MRIEEELVLEPPPKTRQRPRKKIVGEARQALDVVQQAGAALSSPVHPSAPGLMEEVLDRKNMQMALKRVMSNKGCPGWDELTVEELPDYLRNHWPSIRSSLLAGDYKPGPVKRARIPKANGGERKLGIPTVVDRLIQQALQQILSRLWEPTFSERSFGFRPGRSCHQAIDIAQQEVRAGRNVVVDIDLDSFFDRVNHDRLMHQISQRITDKRILALIGRYLRAGILENGLITTPDKGTPQGGPLSPLLSNVVLDELDKELEHRGHRFVRYADDCNIYVRTERAGKRVMSGVKRFIEKTLKLKVNEVKSAVAKACSRKFLGFSFTDEEAARVRVSEASIKRFKDRIRELTGRQSIELRKQISILSRYLQGWMGYYGRSEEPETIRTLDKWIRRRLRVLHLKRWRTPSTRFREFHRLGMSKADCRFVTHTTKRFWYLSGTSAVNRTLNLKYFRELRLYFMADRYAL